MTLLADQIRESRAAQLEARQIRSRSRALRASMRSARLEGRRIVAQSEALRASLEAERLIERVASLSPRPPVQRPRDMKPLARRGE